MTGSHQYLAFYLLSVLWWAPIAASQRRPLGESTFDLATVNGQPLPATDSVPESAKAHRGSLRLRAATLSFHTRGAVVLTMVTQDLFRAGLPCEALRELARLDSMARADSSPPLPSGQLRGWTFQITDTTRSGCDDLSTTTSEHTGSFRLVGDSIYLVIPDTEVVEVTFMAGTLSRDSVVITRAWARDTTVYTPFGASRLTFNRRSEGR